jgi:hypothetical protein
LLLGQVKALEYGRYDINGYSFRMAKLTIVHLCLQASFFINGVLNMGGFGKGEGGGTSNDAAP